MSDSEELNRLADLHQRGILSDEEFAKAKARVLTGETAGTAGAAGAGTSGAWTSTGPTGTAYGPDSASHGSARYATPQGGAPAINAINALRRSRDDRWIGGVCGGIARLTGITSWFWRIVFVGLTLCGGVGPLLYLLMWIFIPQED
ncbi:PspC domain-containing protein [Roseateles sp.]|uniref:PspC domain-containing protein n=1 Tax=Roseateles sp. TaxID=1971397 RepID=UPI0031CFF772